MIAVGRAAAAVLLAAACDRPPPPRESPATAVTASPAAAASGSAAPSPRLSSIVDTGMHRRVPDPGSELPTRLDSAIALGERLYQRDQRDSAVAIWRAVLERSRAEHDSVSEARALTWLGSAAYRSGDLANARRVSEEALALKRRWALRADLASSYNTLGLIAWDEGRLADATELYGKAAAAAQAAGDLKTGTKAALNLALAQFDLGEFTEARRGFDSARVAGHRLGDARIEGNALTNRAMLEIRLGAPDAAIPLLRDARRLYASIGYATGEQNALAQLGTAYDALGEARLALAALDTAVAITRTRQLRTDEASNLHSLADVHREAGDHRRALELLGQAAAINRAAGRLVDAATDLRSEAEIYARLDALEPAAALAREAAEMHRTAGAEVERLDDLLLLADLADRAGDANRAARDLGEARALAVRLGTPRARAQVAVAAARLAERRGDAPAVLAALRSVDAAWRSAAYDLEPEADWLRLRALARLGRLVEAAAAGRRAVAAIERVRSGYGSDALRSAYLATRQDVYADLAGVLLRLGRTDEALQVADAARSRAFLDRLAAAYAGGGASRPLERRLAERELLLRRIDQLAAKLDSAASDVEQRARVPVYRARLERARSEFEAFSVQTAELAGVAPALVLPNPTGAALARRLQPGDALVEFLVGRDSLRTFVVTRAGLTAVAVAVSRGQLASRVRIARERIAASRGDSLAGRAALEALYELLIAPVRRGGALAGVRRLLIVPHDVLAYVPFAALRDAASGRYLVQDAVIEELPSAGALIAMPQPGAGPPASPVSATVFTPLTAQLPATLDEARTLRRTLDAAWFSGSRATESEVRVALESPGLVHLATHAELNPGNPLFSRIQLAPVPGEGAAADGRLEVHEILDLRIASDLVFLSGCETGLGAGATTEFAAGEDYATLAHAFLYAGARGVVATLWRVNDRAAAELGRRFYRRYAGARAAEALAWAQRELLADPRYRAPYFWAGYVLTDAGAEWRPQIVEHRSVN